MHLSTPDAKASSPQSQIAVIAEYGSAISQVTQPLSYVAMSHYYVSRWAAEVGGTGTLLILNLRALGYFNPATGETRGDITISLPELAKRCGVSVNTIKRELATNAALQRFVSKESRYRRDRTGEVYRTENAYHIRMDDPLHPSDEPKVQEIVEAMQKGSPDGMAQNGRGRKRAKAQYDTSQTQNEPGGVQPERVTYQTGPAPVKNDTGGVQNGLTLKNHSVLPPITQNTKNTGEIAASPPVSSFSSSQKESEGFDHDSTTGRIFGLVMAAGGDRGPMLAEIATRMKSLTRGTAEELGYYRLYKKLAEATALELRRGARL